LRRPEDKEKKRPAGTTYEYEITSGDETFDFIFSITDEYQGGRYIDYFEILPQSQSNKAFASLKWFKPFRLAMVILSIIEIGYSFYMIALCLKEKPRFWGFWLLFIFTVYGGVSFSFTEKLKIGMFVYTFAMPKILIYTGLGFEIYLSVPIGAIAYWFQRKRKLPERNNM